MKTEELKQIGLTDDQIKAVMEFNGKDITHAKDVANAEKQKEIDGLNAQLSQVTDALKKFDGIEPEKLTGEITNLNQQIEQLKADHQKQIAERDFNDLLNNSIKENGGRNTKAITAMLDLETLRASKNQKEDVKAAIEQVKKENDYMFTSNEPLKNAVTGTNNGGAPAGNTSIQAEAEAKARAVMGLPPLKTTN